MTETEKKNRPYQCAVVVAGQAMARGYYLKIYELRLFGGLMKAGKQTRNHKPWVLASRSNGNPLMNGPKWMAQIAEQINDLKTMDPNEVLAVIDHLPDYNPDAKKQLPKSIHRPRVEDLCQ